MNTKTTTRKDKLHGLRYCKLSYKGKFERTLWGGVIVTLLCALLLPNNYKILSLSKNVFIFLIAVAFIIQAVYNHIKWKEGK